MIPLLATVVGILYAVGVFLLLQRQLARLIIGLSLLTSATNLLVFTVGGPVRGNPPLVPEGADSLAAPFADPIPQALVLTAIVIGFGVLVFTMVLGYRGYQSTGTDDLEQLQSTDALEPVEHHDPVDPRPTGGT